MIGQKIGHYAVIDKLGEGGMGVVYKARDTRLDRFVALKVLPPEKVADADRKRRFIQEAKAASALNHPNIITIHDISEEAGADFIVMEYVAGKTLRQAIPPQGLAPEEALQYGVQIADALAAAHRAGIVHRDLKPGNVMVTEEGLVKVLDFGLAKLTEPASQETLTMAGAILGTVDYMPPEQAEGRPADARSDIFSFGAVLYEMLTGRKAFRGVLREAPPATGVRHMDQIVSRCLRTNPEDRFQRAGDLKQALEEAARGGSLPSIAVLPFANLTADKENEYFSDGLAEEIINALTQISGLRVTARTSAFAFRGKEMDVSEIGARLKVGAILEGSVRKAGNRIRVTAQLINVADGYHLWSERYDREMTDVFAIQDEISQAIVDKLRVRLVGDRPLVKRYTDNLEAYNLYLTGRYHLFRLTQAEVRKSRECFEQARSLDPGYALACAGLADCYWVGAFFGHQAPKEALPRGKAAAMEALRLDDTLAEAHASLGNMFSMCDFDWARADREFQRALELNPASSIVHAYYSFWFLRSVGRLDEALSEMRRALELDPLSALFNSELAHLFQTRRQYDAAIAQFQHVIELDPHFYLSYWLLAYTYTQKGMFEEAIAAAEKALELGGRSPAILARLGVSYALSGRRAEARKLLDELKDLRRATYVPPTLIAWIHRDLGETNQAFEWLDQAVVEHDLIAVSALKAEPGYDPLRSDPRYPSLLRKMNLA